jgi:tRNA pseudouridine55 synthase
VFGILLIDKPQGITSHGVISRLRKALDTRRIGHAGTLDPLATGLLVVAVGPATRFLQYLNLEPKTYVSTVKFGESTNTYDAEGEVTETRPVPSNLEEQISQHIPQFLGKITQSPPIYSAIKVQGKPLYEYARRGEEVEIKTRTQNIHSYTLDSIYDQEATFTIVCDGGTYIRSLAHDLGEAIGCGAHIKELRRTGAGQFQIDQAIPLEQATDQNIIPAQDVLTHIPQIHLTTQQIDDIRHGRAIEVETPLNHNNAVLISQNGNVVSIANVVKETTLQPDCVIPYELFDEIIANS